MADVSVIETRIGEVKDLIKIWNKFYELLMKTFTGEELTDADETAFSQIKQIIAERHESFMQAVSRDHYIAQAILDSVKRTISIREFPDMSDVALDKTLLEWHNANILLYETLGSLEWQKESDSFKDVSEEKERKRALMVGRFKALVGHRILKNLLAFVIIAGAVGGVLWFFREQIGQSSYYLSFVAPWWTPIWNNIIGILGGGGA